MEPDQLQNLPNSNRRLVPVVFDDSDCAGIDNSEKSSACIVGEEVKPQLLASLQELGYEVSHVLNINSVNFDTTDWSGTVFVLETFEGEQYDILCSKKCRIVGPPCVLLSASTKKPLPNTTRPVYSINMEGTVICFIGFKDKQKLHHLSSLVHMMGGSIRKDVSNSVTHVVAHVVTGSKYKVAVGFGLPIMSEEWILQSWEKRNLGTSSMSSEMMIFKLLPFVGCVIALYGFSEEDTKDMETILIKNGGTHSKFGQPGLTHLVVCDLVETEAMPPTPSNVFVVRQQWFWESIQLEACADVTLYLAKEHNYKRNKRRLPLRFSADTQTPLVSLSSSHSNTQYLGADKQAKSKEAARQHITAELLQTEKNFVNILQIINHIFKEPLEVSDHNAGQILSHEDIKSIFSNIADILTVHKRLVSKLETEVAKWSNTSCIGHIFLEEADDLVRVYPPFVNFFEMSKDALIRCDRMYPRFHAFLKANESRPECGRQTLAELLIVPVQRIPRIVLLLQDLLKHTESSHTDYSHLENAVGSLKVVMSHVNEDKRKTEAQVKMFEILRDIEQCPATLLSSNRSLLEKLDVIDIGNPDKSIPLSLFIFSDSIEIAKRRSPNFGLTTKAKMYKHLEFFYHTQIKAVVEFSNSEDTELEHSFGLLIQWSVDLQEKLLAFRITDESLSTLDIIARISKILASVSCSTDPEQFIFTTSAEVFHLQPKSDTSATYSLRRAIKGARKRVKRAFSTRSSKSRASSSTNMENIDENEKDGFDTISLASPSSSISTPVFTPKAKRPALANLVESAPDFSNCDTDV